MYAVIQTGGKQYRVAEGDRLEVERVDGDELSLQPVLLVDGESGSIHEVVFPAERHAPISSCQASLAPF